MINIAKADKAAVLAALYNNSHPLGLGVLHYSSEDMTRETASEFLDAFGGDFDYLNGRVIKVNLSGDEFSPHLYDRDNSEGAAAKALESVEGVVVTEDYPNRFSVSAG